MPARFAPGVVAFGAAAVAAALGKPAAAEAVHLSYSAPAGCPGEAALTEAIATNGGHLMRAPEELPARTFALTIAKTSNVSGRLIMRDREGRESTRIVRGAGCEEVVQALAVVAAFALEPDVVASPGPPSTPAPAPARELPAPPEPAEPTEPPSPQVHEPARDQSAYDVGPLPAGWRFGASAEGTLGQVGGGIVAPGVAAHVDVVHDVADLSAFSLRLGAEIAKGVARYESTSPYYSTTSTMDVERRVLRLDACPVRAVASQPWSSSTLEAWACGRLDAGVLQVVQSASDSQTRPWVAPGARVAARWVERRFFFELEGNLTFPLLREIVVGASERVAYRIPWAVGGGGIGVGWFLL
jgi:hypothetical protein